MENWLSYGNFTVWVKLSCFFLFGKVMWKDSNWVFFQEAGNIPPIWRQASRKNFATSQGFLFIHHIFIQFISPKKASIPACSHKPKCPHLSCWSCSHMSLMPTTQKCLLWNPRWRRLTTASGSTVLRSVAISDLNTIWTFELWHILSHCGTCIPCSSQRVFQIPSMSCKGWRSRMLKTSAWIVSPVCFCFHVDNMFHFFRSLQTV